MEQRNEIVGRCADVQKYETNQDRRLNANNTLNQIYSNRSNFNTRYYKKQ